MNLSASSAAASFDRLGPLVAASPIILSVPHAGREYPEALLAATRLGRESLVRFEDRLVDRLVAPLAERGHVVLIARLARAWIDLNRDESELDPAMIDPRPAEDTVFRSARVRGGLGLIPRRVIGEGDIYRGPIDARDLARRIECAHRPFHEAIGTAVAATKRRFGIAVLIDCHSMPPLGSDRPGGEAATVVIGDRNGCSAGGRFTEVALHTLRAQGFSVALNAPYAGSHILDRHGLAGSGAHALQLELCRSLYLDATLHEPGPRFAAIANLVGVLADALNEIALGRRDLLAAE